jgi:undecaprenyl diphosphate synthase
MLFQMAYAEIIFVQKNWPDFKESDLIDVIKQFHERQRRFGNI